MSALRKNILSLFVLQGANYILPLVTIPCLVRVLEPVNFGRIAFAMGIAGESGNAVPDWPGAHVAGCMF